MKAKRIRPPAYADRHTLEVEGIARTFWVAPGPDNAEQAGDAERSPLLLGFHGLGGSGSRLAWWSGLDTRGPQAGFLCVFPDALNQVWDDRGCGRRDGADDAAFVAALIDHLARTRGVDPERVFVTGVSTGATFLERIVRCGDVRVRGVALVTGTARLASASKNDIVGGGTPLLLIAGTADPMLPYEGGPARGAMGRLALRHVRKFLVDASGHQNVAPEELAAEWANANGCELVPSVKALVRDHGNFPIARLTWEPASSAGAAVVLYRVDGAGHGWPGARQYLPARLIGRIPQNVDGTEIVLDFARAALADGGPLPAKTHHAVGATPTATPG